jgi:hypothetical protein
LRFALAALWILLGSAITFGLYWTFLITPESTIWTVIASGLLALASLLMAGFTASGAIALLSHGPSMPAVRRAVRAIGGAIPAAIIVFVLWWLTTRAEAWVAMRSGQISAMFIARFGWDNISWLFAIVHRTAQWVRWLVAAVLSLSLIAGMVAVGWSAIAQTVWLRRALRPRGLIAATLWFVALIALPWMYLVPWRPRALPASSVEFAFIVAKLSVSAILFAIGATMIAYEASRTPVSPPDPATAVAAA